MSISPETPPLRERQGNSLGLLVARTVECFEYPHVGPGVVDVDEISASTDEPEPPAISAADLDAEREAAYRQGLHDGEQRARQKMEAHLQHERQAIAKCVRQFAVKREQYFQRIETEVVQLALSIAAKVLRREANIDPLLLGGVVKVALERLQETSGTRLCVHPSRAQMWREYLERQMKTGMPEVKENAALDADQCVLESTMGTIELGVDAQLQEIERGLFELVSRKPEGSDQAVAKGASA